MDENEIATAVIRAAYKVRKVVGMGVLEGVYEKCLIHELKAQGLSVVQEEPVPIVFNGESIDTPYRSDIVVEQKLIVELKTVEEIRPIHIAQLLTYLRIKECKLGLLINFNAYDLKKGIRRVFNNRQ